jgi:hypothetical protein
MCRLSVFFHIFVAKEHKGSANGKNGAYEKLLVIVAVGGTLGLLGSSGLADND